MATGRMEPKTCKHERTLLSFKDLPLAFYRLLRLFERYALHTLDYIHKPTKPQQNPCAFRASHETRKPHKARASHKPHKPRDEDSVIGPLTK